MIVAWKGSVRRGHRGVTLIEVLIAVGVMAIGLLGMAALIPLGKLELAEGNRLDNVASVGRAAFRDLVVRGYLRPEMWVDPLTGHGILPQLSYTNEYSMTTTAQTARMFQATTTTMVGPPYAPLVIDPLMVAPQFFNEPVNSNNLTSDEQSHRTNCTVFPYSAKLPGMQDSWPEHSIPKLARVTLRVVPPNVATGGGSNSLATTMKFDAASRFFRASDDIVVTIPTDKVLRPVQEFAITTPALTNLSLTAFDGVSQEIPISQVAYRKFRGDYSWFLVVEPSLAESYGTSPATMPVLAGPNASLLTSKQFRVWTVVCHKRDLRPTGNMDLSVDRNVGERAVWVDFLDRNTVRLRIQDADKNTAMNVLKLQPNQWIAVIGKYQEPALVNSPTGSPPLRYVMEWYRIVNVAEEVQNGTLGDNGQVSTLPNNVWYREATVAGRDFSNLGFEFLDADFFNYPDVTAVARSANAPSAEPLTGWGVIVTGARGVYEKMVYVDRPSSWSIATE